MDPLVHFLLHCPTYQKEGLALPNKIKNLKADILEKTDAILKKKFLSICLTQLRFLLFDLSLPDMSQIHTHLTIVVIFVLLSFICKFCKCFVWNKTTLKLSKLPYLL